MSYFVRLATGVVLVLALGVAEVRPARASSDPPVPGGGFSLLSPTLLHTYSDGYEVLIDIRFPSPFLFPPGPCGWPAIALVHGSSGSRLVISGPATNLATQGYLTIAYDVRGQGPSYAMNNQQLYGRTFGIRELIDLAEVFEAVKASFPAYMDETRLGVTGNSQGGVHSFLAAAHSGRTLPQNPWRSEPFPVISAVVPSGYVPQPVPVTYPEGKSVHQFALAIPSGTLPTLADFLLQTHKTETFQNAVEVLFDPDLDALALLPQSTVPIYARLSYDDYWVPADQFVELWPQLLPDVPRKLDLSTGTHSSPNNVGLEFQYNLTRLQWLNRFLKGIENGVEEGDPIFLAITPDREEDYLDHTFEWDSITLPSFDHPSIRYRKAYLRRNRRLRERRPGGTEPPDLIQHRNLSGATMAEYACNPQLASETLEDLPLSSINYDSAIVPFDVHLVGMPRVQLHIESPHTALQLHAALFDLDPQTGEERYIAGGGVTFRDDIAAGNNVVEWNVYYHSYRIREGRKLRLRIENMIYHRAPVGGILRYAPLFTDFDVNILHDEDHLSFIDLSFIRD